MNRPVGALLGGLTLALLAAGARSQLTGDLSDLENAAQQASFSQALQSLGREYGLTLKELRPQGPNAVVEIARRDQKLATAQVRQGPSSQMILHLEKAVWEALLSRDEHRAEIVVDPKAGAIMRRYNVRLDQEKGQMYLRDGTKMENVAFFDGKHEQVQILPENADTIRVTLLKRDGTRQSLSIVEGHYP